MSSPQRSKATARRTKKRKLHASIEDADKTRTTARSGKTTLLRNLMATASAAPSTIVVDPANVDAAAFESEVNRLCEAHPHQAPIVVLDDAIVSGADYDATPRNEMVKLFRRAPHWRSILNDDDWDYYASLERCNKFDQ